MSTQTFYKLGLCRCGEACSPFYLEVAKHGLPNAFPGYYTIHSENPGVIFITPNSGGHIKEQESDEDEQTQVKYPIRSTSVKQNVRAAIRPTTSRPHVPPSVELKPTALQAVMGNSIQNPQRNLVSIQHAQNVRHLSSLARESFIPTNSALKPIPFPKPSTSQGPPKNNVVGQSFRQPSSITQERVIPGTNTAVGKQSGSFAPKKKNQAPMPPTNTFNSSFKNGNNKSTIKPLPCIPPKPSSLAAGNPPPPPPIPSSNTMANQGSSGGNSSDFPNLIRSFNKNNLKSPSNSLRNEVKKAPRRPTGTEVLFEALEVKMKSIRPAHSDSSDENENSGRNDSDWS